MINATDKWRARANAHLQTLCAGRDRRPGSPENLASTSYAARMLTRYGWSVREPEFDVISWEGGAGRLTLPGFACALFPSPYSFGVEGSGQLVVAGTLGELTGRDIAGAIVVLHGTLSSQPLTPKSFPFYQVDEHRHLVRLLESGDPLAVVTATGSSPELAGAISPFPLIEDGDFQVPTAHIDRETGTQLRRFDGMQAKIALDAQRWAAIARNVIGSGDRSDERIVVIAHIDTKVNTPGAIDNAAGVAVVLLLAEVLEREDHIGVEILIVNGEDYYNAAGEMHYLNERAGNLGDIGLAINIDGVGFRDGSTRYSLYNCDDALAGHLRPALDTHGLFEGSQWWQSDHAIFAMKGVPALALTSERQDYLLRHVIHGPHDTVDQVDLQRLVQAAEALGSIIREHRQEVGHSR
jgi:aminopeptidase YwaD